MDRNALMLEAVKRGKYAPLFHHLSGLQSDIWSPSFRELERVLGFSLPNSARLYRPWWANDSKSGHSQAVAWMLADWRTKDVDLEGEVLTFYRISV